MFLTQINCKNNVVQCALPETIQKKRFNENESSSETIGHYNKNN